MELIRIAGIVDDSIVDGPGIRLTVFFQGCLHNCDGCHNPTTHDINGGYLVSVDEIISKILSNPLLSGVTFSGGEPLLQIDNCINLAKKIKEMNLNIILYTGYNFEEIIKLQNGKELLKYIDYVIDGKYIKEKRSLELKYRGSSNQRIINVNRTLLSNEIIIKEL